MAEVISMSAWKEAIDRDLVRKALVRMGYPKDIDLDRLPDSVFEDEMIADLSVIVNDLRYRSRR